MAKNQRNLFDGSDSNDEDCELKPNPAYAKHYDEFRKKELLSHCK